MKKLFPGVTAVVSGAVTAAIGTVMNAFLIPRIEQNTGGIRCFDMNFGYTCEEAQRFLSLAGEEGRRVYLSMQLPLDFVYPLAYALFFVSLFVILTKKKTKLAALPIALAAADYAENILVEAMLRSSPLSSAVVSAASVFTVIKTVLLYTVIIITLALVVRAAVRAKKAKREE